SSRSPTSAAALNECCAIKRSRLSRRKSAWSGATEAAFVIAAKASFASPAAFARRARRAHAFASFGSATVRRTLTSNASFVRRSASSAPLSPASAVVSFGFLARTVSYTARASSYRWSSVKHAPCLVPQARGRRVRLDGDVKRLHRIGVASEGEQESGLSGRRVRVPGIEPEHGVERGQRVLRLIQRLMGLSPRGPGAGVRGIFL